MKEKMIALGVLTILSGSLSAEYCPQRLAPYSPGGGNPYYERSGMDSQHGGYGQSRQNGQSYDQTSDMDSQRGGYGQSRQNGQTQRDWQSNQQQNSGMQNGNRASNSNGRSLYQNSTMNGTTSDHDLQRQIKDALMGHWFSKNYPEVKFQVNNGTVTLMGEVDTDADKRDVENKLRHLPGVKDVRNMIDVKASNGMNGRNRLSEARQNGNGVRSGDMEIQRMVMEKLNGRWAMQKYSDVNIRVRNGTVTLTGFVESAADKRDIENKVKNISQVDSVQNNLEVKGAQARPSQSQQY